MLQKSHGMGCGRDTSPSMQTAFYSLGGLRIESDLPLWGLHVFPNKAEERCEVVVRRRPIADKVSKTIAKFIDGHYSGAYDGRDVLIEYSPLGRFLLRGGEEILIDTAPSSDHDEVRAYLLGAVFGALCHQRGIIPLHASAIDVANGCIAFVGASGAGKSTMAAALAQRGHDIVADDECFLQLGTRGEVLAAPGVSYIRLLEDTRAALGFPAVQQESQRHGKYFIPVNEPKNPMRSRPLRGVYQLHRIPNGVTKVTRLRGAEAVEVLMQNVYPPNFAARLGYESNVFRVCAAAARDMPVFQLSRPHDFAALDQVIELLENQLGAHPNRA
jgi:hypothetical protein